MTPSSKKGSATRDRIVAAAIETVRAEGFANTTARAIAAHGGFNQALIFYHFGSVDELLDEAFARVSEQQVAHYREAVQDLSSLGDLVHIARRLHAEDTETGVTTTVTQMMAAASDPERGGALLDRFDLWIELVQEALQRVSAQYPVAAAVPSREAAYAICCMFLGIELLTRLDPARSEAESVFDMMDGAAALVEQLAPALAAFGGMS